VSELCQNKDHVRLQFCGIADFRLEEAPRPKIRGSSAGLE